MAYGVQNGRDALLMKGVIYYKANTRLIESPVWSDFVKFRNIKKVPNNDDVISN